MGVRLVRLDGLKFRNGHVDQPFRRQHGLIAVDGGGKCSGPARGNGAGIARGLRLKRIKLRLQGADARLQRAAVGAASRAPQDEALELRRKIGDGIHVAQRQVPAQLRKRIRDVRVERSLIVDAGDGAPRVLKLLDLAGQLVHARLPEPCVLGAVAGGDGVVRGHVRAFGTAQNGRAVLRI